MKIAHIVGNRPQFIKLAPISRKLREFHIEESIIHTGQHYDENMSDIFFEELDIPEPKINLNVGSGTHAQVTAKMVEKLETEIIKENPDGVIIYGDTNSTLAAAIVVSKFNIPLFHIEAGPRTYSRSNPEEKNRIVADHLSDYLFAPDKISVENLKREGIDPERIIFSGDVMYDEFLNSSVQDKKIFKEKYPEDFVLMTWHREENTCSRDRMEKLLSFIQCIDYKIVLPLHPRTRKMLSAYKLLEMLQQDRNVLIVEPVGYKEMTFLMDSCKFIISDSGGVSKEASFAGKKCFFPLKLEVWPELIERGYITIVDLEDIKSVRCSIEMMKEVLNGDEKLEKTDFFGNGNAAEIIVDTIQRVCSM
ncbi:MAG: UDP-N-acetylglucosamine 2-epimerase (non-hydrolyzing) [Hungatella sp.]|nr:UDP-N-acetylglucosamine 2-epimerase (non-hydrolyzing) [Hungatella sp.]